MPLVTPWHRLVNPGREELERVQRRFGLHPLVLADVFEGRQHPSFERIDEAMRLTLWDLDPDGSPAVDVGDIALVFDAHDLLIIQQGPDDRVRDLDAVLSAPGPWPVTSPIAGVYRVLEAVVLDFVAVGADVEHELDEVEAEVFDSRVREDYRRIYRLRQHIGRIDRAVSGLAEALRDARLEIESATADVPALRPYFAHLATDAAGVAELAAAAHSALDAVVSSHQSNVAARQNQDMRTISAFAALLAIPTLIAGVYGMNFKNIPLVRWEFGWLVIGIAMVALDLVIYWMFRRRGWLGARERLRDARPSGSAPAATPRGTARGGTRHRAR
ncbi:CorA family divalent cation transporter [Agromyces soli]